MNPLLSSERFENSRMRHNGLDPFRSEVVQVNFRTGNQLSDLGNEDFLHKFYCSLGYGPRQIEEFVDFNTIITCSAAISRYSKFFNKISSIYRNIEKGE